MTATRAPQGRLPALDGIRGVAAVVVVVHHTFLTFPEFAAVQYGEPRRGALTTALSYSPLHLVWAGPEAVLVFFVLSGLVLASSADRRGGFSWPAYYASRLARLYLPVVAAVGVAVLAHAWASGAPTPESQWLEARARPITADRIVGDLTLLGGTTGVLSPLWSLRWEVWFSLLLPAYLFLRTARIPTSAAAVTLLGCAFVGVLAADPALQFLPVFGLGVLLWRHRALALDGPDWTPRRTTTAAASAVLLLSAPWHMGVLIDGRPADAFAFVLAIVGSVLAIVLGQRSGWCRRQLSSAFSLWLGRISFSLYLVHEPVVVLLARWWGHSAATAVAGIAISLLAGWCFYLLVERRSHRLARRVHHVMSARPVRAAG